MLVNVTEAKAHFAELLKRAEAGEEIILTRHGKPVARIAAIVAQAKLPRIGALAGRIEIAEDFDAPLDAFAAYRP